MKTLRFRLTLLGGVLLMLAFTSVASAQATRTWVSGVGDDVNPCSRTAPCKTFAGAISKTANGGEIDCLDPGGFGTLTVTKSIIIDCDSGAGGILASAGIPGLTVNATAGTDFVILRNLTINGGSITGGFGTNGINVISAKLIGLEDVVINNFTTNCVNVTSSSTVNLYADNSNFINCGTGTAAGVNAGTNSKVLITRSLIATPGIGVLNSGTSSQAFVTGSSISGTAFAFQSSTGNFIGASGNTVANSGGVFNQAGGSIFTGSDNPGFGNGPTGPTSGAVGKI
jgi:hypothetical protein